MKQKITKIDENTLEVETVVITKIFKDHLIKKKESLQQTLVDTDEKLAYFE